jgi:predicted nuclease of predicted toxin-antitoxin system
MMLLDENLSPKIATALQDVFAGIKHVRDFGALGANDSTVWNLAKAYNLAIVTKDGNDFIHLISLHGIPPKVIWIRKGNCPTAEIIELLRAHALHILSFIRDDERGVLEIG